MPAPSPGPVRSLLLAGCLALLACGGSDLGSPQPGDITVTTVTTGTASDPDGYTLTLDGVDGGRLGENASLTLDDIPSGTHSIGLSGVASDCHAETENPRSVDIPAGGGASVEFRLVCLRPPERLRGGPELPEPLPPSEGDAFFVAPEGDDANPGTLAEPWSTIQKAMDALEPGQVAWVRAGTYETGLSFGTDEDTHTWDSECSRTAPCSILAFPGERPVIHGQIRLEGEGLRLSGFVIEGPLSADVTSCSGRQANQIDVVGASYVEISHNEIRDNDYHAGVNVSLGGHVQILGNWIHDNGRFSIETDPCTGNEVFETDQGIYWESAGNESGNLVADNLIQGNRAKGIQFFNGQLGEPVAVVHNTIVGNGNAGLVVNGSGERTIIVNNVVAFNGTAAPRSQIRIQDGDDHLVRRNLTFALDSELAGVENETESTVEENIEADPAFESGAAGDFHLSSVSPGIDAADDRYATGSDLDHTARPQGQAADLGAYER